MIRFIDENGIIEPDSVVGGAKKAIREFGATSAVGAFSNHIFNEIISAYGGKKIASVSGGIDNDLYGIYYNGKPIVAYKSPVGAPAAVMAAEETLACGIENLVTFGICGALERVSERTFIVPTFACRDEGTSLHYADSSETIALRESSFVKGKLDEYGLETLVGGAWCTDALYRETVTRMNEMREKGCVAVDMECSALQAMCDYRGKKFYTFFITADSLAGGEWNPNYILDISLAPPDAVGVMAAVRLAFEL